MTTLISQLLLEIVFGTIVFLHITKKNFSMVLAYALQSLALSAILLGSFFETGNMPLMLIALFELLVKVFLAPIFFIKLIQKHEVPFSTSTYLNTPLSLIVIAALTFIAYSKKFLPLSSIVASHQALLALALAAMFLSFFLIINRKGALSQIIGILSLENSIVAFSIFAGLEQSPALQLGIIFAIIIWLIIARVFMSMIYKHFGSLDITAMKHLTD